MFKRKLCNHQKPSINNNNDINNKKVACKEQLTLVSHRKIKACICTEVMNYNVETRPTQKTEASIACVSL